MMIVDDVEVMRRDVKRLKLWGESSGFMIEAEAVDGLDALEQLENNSFDLVITDIRMPRVDGIELLRQISERKLCPVTVLLSDFTEYHFARQGILYGAFDYIGKPVEEASLAELLGRIGRYLGNLREEERQNLELQDYAHDAISLTEDKKQLIHNIKSRNLKAVDQAVDLIGRICHLYHYDHFKAMDALKNTTHELIGALRQTYPWLELFIDLDQLEADFYSGSEVVEELQNSANGILRELIVLLNKLMGSPSSELISKTCEYVLTHVDEETSVKLLSEKLFINKSYLSETFKQKFGTTLLQYINMVKIERAKKLLQEGKLRNYQISEILGFKDPEYFGRLFKKNTGVLPKNYRK
ncbi:response regulator transcription factor [Anoxybacterium hadale]|uniref:response regulator transcription factor n=1 Tax=Anoxybacterium hadale TaxID=3408580 RepID=UPI003B006FDF